MKESLQFGDSGIRSVLKLYLFLERKIEQTVCWQTVEMRIVPTLVGDKTKQNYAARASPALLLPNGRILSLRQIFGVGHRYATWATFLK